MRRRVFVMEPYIPNGGTYMAYHLANILCDNFGFDGVAVGNTKSDHGIMSYEKEFPLIPAEQLPQYIESCDCLISNPSFSHFHFGLTCRGRKLMYVQGFNTFSLIDRRYNHYVAVSKVVQRLLSSVYNIDAPIIPAFIDTSCFPEPRHWADRTDGSIFLSPKSPSIYTDHLVSLLDKKGVKLNITYPSTKKIPQVELARLIGIHQFFLSLAPAEGFGLLPLEAMALGSIVLGFDGYGGQDYLQSKINSVVVPYCEIEALADLIIFTINDRKFAERISNAGRITAKETTYTYSQFRSAWCNVLEEFLAKPLEN